MKHSFRHLSKNKGYAFINLFGLTLGLSVCIFIFLYVQDELNYDRYLPGYERVFRIQPAATTAEGQEEWATSEGFVVPALTAMYPEIEYGTKFLRNDNDIIFRTDSLQFAQEGTIAGDSTFFKVFPFEFIYGDRNTALDKPEGIVLTRSVSKKFFGDIDPVGKILTTDFATFTVTGMVEDVPRQSHFSFKVVFSYKVWWPDADQSRTMYAFYSFIRLQPAANAAAFVGKTLKEWYMAHGLADNDNATDADGTQVVLKGMPLSDIHLKSHVEKEFAPNGDLQRVYIFVGVSVLILIIATINYINLSNAMAIRRSREVAVRKTIGASRTILFTNFLVESWMLTLVAFVLSLAIVALLIPSFNTFTGKHLQITELLAPDFVMGITAAWIILGFLAGFYPAVILSSFNPIQAMRSGIGSAKTNKLSLYLRRGLIISQFAITAVLIFGALSVRRQLSYIETRNIGFDKSNVIVIPLIGEARFRYEVVKNEISKAKGVVSSSVSSVVPGKRVVILTVRIPDLAGTQPGVQGADNGDRGMRVMGIDHDFVKTLGLQIAEGRDFSNENAADSAHGFLLNEAAVKYFNLKDPVGKPFEYTFGREPKKGAITGIVKDFNFASVHTAVEPLMMHVMPSFYSNLCVRIQPGQTQSALNDIEASWKKITSAPFSYQFLDANYDALYRAEQTTGSVITLFTIIALVIAGLGLFGIVSFFAVQRTREVGVRKVFGASHRSLIKVLSEEYLVMVLAGNLIAIYPAWLLVNQWLQQFAYHIQMSFTGFVLAFVFSEILAMVSIIYVILKTARVNPALILRHE